MTRSNLGNLMIVLMPALATAGGILAFCGIHGVKAGNWILSPGRHRHTRADNPREAIIAVREPVSNDLDGDRQSTLAPIAPGSGLIAANRPATFVAPPNHDRRTGNDVFKSAPHGFETIIERGDSLSGVLVRLGARARETEAAVNALRPLYNPRNLQVGQKVSIRFRPPTSEATDTAPDKKTLLGFRLHKNISTDIEVNLRPDGRFQARETPRRVFPRSRLSSGAIKSSLYGAGRQAGVPAAVLAKLIRAYSWEVDFQREIRAGDRFEVLFNVYVDEGGAVVQSGEVLFARLRLSGADATIYRHAIADGTVDYFDDKGHGAKRALMRTPIDGARLSSGFGNRRHPILGYDKMHRGVDFAAPSGTPVYAAGDGVVERAGPWSGYGNYIRIRHNDGYSTAYAHLRNYAKGIHKGKRVRQGRIIGYVGATGLSTGPHLHYEILKNGRRLNPMRVKMPSGKKLTGKPLKRFMAEKSEIDRKVASLRAAKRATIGTAGR